MPLRYQNQTRKLLQTVIDFNMFNSAKCVFMYCMSLCIGVIILFEIVLLLLNSQVTSLWHYEWKCFVKYCWVNVIIKCVFMYIYMSGRSCHWRDNIRVYYQHIRVYCCNIATIYEYMLIIYAYIPLMHQLKKLSKDLWLVVA
jgi:hypothetical protein